MTRRSFGAPVSVAFFLAALALAPACDRGCSSSPITGSVPAIPASSDPQGRDLVEGAVVVAEEADSGFRVLKIVHVEDYPDPIGYEMHLIAYDPKVDSYEAGAKQWAEGPAARKIALDHVFARRVHFLKRAYRVIAVEPVTDAERAPYLKSLHKY